MCILAQPSLKGIPVMDKDKADRRNFRRPGENVYIGENVEIKYHFHSYPAAEFSLFKTVEYPQYTYALNPRGLYDQLLALALEKVNITGKHYFLSNLCEKYFFDIKIIFFVLKN